MPHDGGSTWLWGWYLKFQLQRRTGGCRGTRSPFPSEAKIFVYVSQYKQKKSILFFQKEVYRFATRCNTFLIRESAIARLRHTFGEDLIEMRGTPTTRKRLTKSNIGLHLLSTHISLLRDSERILRFPVELLQSYHFFCWCQKGSLWRVYWPTYYPRDDQRPR